MQILQQLESKSIQAQSSQADPASSAAVEIVEEKLADNQQSSWDLSADALLATLLHEFSSHIAARTHHVASDIRSLQHSVNHVGVDVAVVQTEFMKRSANIFMEQVVGDDDSETDSEEEEDDEAEEVVDKKTGKQNDEQNNDDMDDDNSDTSSAAIARLEAEEQSAISNGMKALKLFFDPKRSSGTNDNGSGGGDNGGETTTRMIDVEEDIIGENCYYYPSAEEDGFNQRPLPFIVGSREFMESSCAGLGGDKHVEANERSI